MNEVRSIVPLECRRCGVIDVPNLSQNGPHVEARCNACGSHIKFMPQANHKPKRDNNAKWRAMHEEAAAQRVDELRCEWCDQTEEECRKLGAHIQIDHVRPLALGGRDVYDNTRPVCSRCHEGRAPVIKNTVSIRRILQLVPDPPDDDGGAGA